MTRTTIVLGCSSMRRSNLAPVVEVLAGRGSPVEVVSGIESNDAPLQEAISRLGSNAVYVLCSDEEVNLRRVGELRRILAMGSVPPARAWCGPIDWSQPTQLLRNVEHLLGARTPVPGPMPRPTPSIPPRTHKTMAVVPVPPSMIGSGPSEMSGTVVPPMTGPSDGASAGRTYTTGEIVGTRNWKPYAAVAGIALVVLGVAVPVMASGDEAETEVATQDVETEQTDEVSAVAAPLVEDADDGAAGGLAPEPTPASKAPAAFGAIPAEGDPGALNAVERDRIFAALAKQEIRALDVLLVGPEARNKSKKGYVQPARLKFDDAQVYCQEMAAGELEGWRLPTAGELASLSDNRMLNRGVYWSETEGDTFGNNRVVFSTSKQQMRSKKRTYRGARTICVRLLSPELAPLDEQQEE